MREMDTAENGFETVFRDSKDGLAIFKGNLFVDCNQSMLDMIGADHKDQFIKNTPDQFSPEFQPDGRPSLEKSIEMIQQCYDQGSVRFEWVHKRLNGEEFWAEIILTKMVLDGEMVVHTNWRDISEKKALELKTQIQKETFETLFNESEDGLCLLTTESYFDCNKAFASLFSASDKDDIIGITPIDLSPEFQPDGRASAEKAVEIIETAFSEGTIRFEWVHRRLDGTEFWADIILFKINVNDREVLYAITRDISEKKALQLEIARQKETFETLFNDSLDGLCCLTKEHYLDCNKAYATLFGAKERGEIIGKTPIDFSPEYQPDGNLSSVKAMEIIDTAFTKGSIRFEWVHKRLDGVEVWCEIVLFRITLNGEEVLYASTRDISEKKALEIEIAKQKETFETMFKESKDGLSIIADGLFFDCNDSFVELFGYDNKDEIVGLTPLQVSAPFQENDEPVESASADRIGKAFTEGSARFEWNHLRKDGSQFWGEVILTKIMLNGVEVLYGTTRDMSVKMALQRETAAQKETFETLFNESDDGLCILSEEGYRDCNKAFLQLFGFDKKEQVIGLTPLDVSPEYQGDGRTTAEAAEGLVESAFNNGMEKFEWLHSKTDGTEFWCEIILMKITLNGEDVLYAISRDISEKKKLELEIIERNAELKVSNNDLERTINNLKQTQDKLVESEKMASLGSLVAGVAHEINTPVGVGLTGVSQLVEECNGINQRYQDGTLSETDFEDFISSAKEISDIVQKNLERTAHLIRSFKQVAVDQTSEEDRQVNIKHYFEEVAFSLASVLRKANAQVSIDCAEDLFVLTNPGLLSQVLTNLIVNSVNHGFLERKSGSIHISVSELSETEFEIHYKDDGKGIAAENLAKIFDPFFTTQRGSGGTGLGLNITYNIITNALKGSIVCHSEEGAGVEFVIRFKVTARIS